MENQCVEERVKVDRRKLLNMLSGNYPINADDFFGKVKDTCPSLESIAWPSNAKINTKSKKDLQVKLAGPRDYVDIARRMILEELDPRRDRVTLKMDVDWTAHGHIIGKLGLQIQKVMKTTGSHVHFPDANRNSNAKKSNQVSVTGTTSGVSQARQMIREMVPVVVWFDFRMKNDFYCLLISDERFKTIQNKTETQFILLPKVIGQVIEVLVSVRGCAGKTKNLIEAISEFQLILKRYTNITKNLNYVVKKEISAHNHNSVIGDDGSNIKEIMKKLNCRISYPDMKPYRFTTNQTNFTIEGKAIKDVLTALEWLQEFLLVTLTFDVQDGFYLDQFLVEKLITNYNLRVVLRPKSKHNSKSVWLTTIEKQVDKLFDARNEILRMVNNRRKRKSWWDSQFTDIFENRENNDLDNVSLTSEQLDEQFEKAPGAGRKKLKQSRS